MSSDLPVEGDPPSISSHDAVDEKSVFTKEEPKVSTVISPSPSDEDDLRDDGKIIRTGLDAATQLLSLRDDGDSALTFRSIVLASGFACFQSVMYQIYQVRYFLSSAVGRPAQLLTWRMHHKFSSNRRPSPFRGLSSSCSLTLSG